MDLYSEVVDVPIDDTIDKEGEGETNGNKPDSVIMASSVDDRLTRRAKRPSKYLIKHLKEGSSSPNGQNSEGGPASAGGLVNGIRTAKNLRRPRNGYGRGLPKKGNNLFPTSSCFDLIGPDVYRTIPPPRKRWWTRGGRERKRCALGFDLGESRGKCEKYVTC